MDFNLDTDQVIELWFHYEEIAMHFNDLLIQYRLQLFAATGAIGGLIFFLTRKQDAVVISYGLRAAISLALLVLFVAAAVLDIFYYQELLSGAVDALIKLECKYPAIDMSTSIARRFSGPDFNFCEGYRDSIGVVEIVYGLVFLPVVAFASYFCWTYWKNY